LRRNGNEPRNDRLAGDIARLFSVKSGRVPPVELLLNCHVPMIASTKNLTIEKLRSMPYGVAFTIGRLMEFFATITFRKSDPPLSRSMVRMIGREFTPSDAAARRELGYVGKTSISDGLRLYRNPPGAERASA
jgi:hypothetical protein